MLLPACSSSASREEAQKPSCPRNPDNHTPVEASRPDFGEAFDLALATYSLQRHMAPYSTGPQAVPEPLKPLKPSLPFFTSTKKDMATEVRHVEGADVKRGNNEAKVASALPH